MIKNKNNNDNHNNHNNNHKHKIKIKKYCQIIKNAFPKKLKENQNILFVWLKGLLLIKLKVKFIFNFLLI